MAISARSLSLLTRGQPTALVGRAGELEAIRRLLTAEGATGAEGARLLTLVGPAGVGKTRLALAAAEQLAAPVTDRFPDGVVVVDLAPVRDPRLVLGTIGRTLGLTDTGTPPIAERLRDYLRERAALLILDNFEQVLPAAVALADLLAGCPRLALLVTSRVPLQLRWERTLRVAPLPIPDVTAGLPPLDELARIPSVALFVARARARARARRADFALTEQQAPLVARLVAQLDGLPLALELAAARLDVLSLPALARRLGDRLRLLAWEAPDRPERQQSLEAAVGWSYDLLSPGEQRLFRCLGVFVGRVALDAIAAVAVAAAGSAGDERRTLDRLVTLAEQSLVLPGQAEEEGGEEEDDDPEPAFGMLETVRAYARERLAAAGELAAASRAHAHYFLALAERADPELRGRDQRAWFLRLEREQDNLRAALRWLLDQDGPDGPDAAAERAAGLRLAAALGWFWNMRAYHTEGWRWLQEALARAPQGDEADLAARIRGLIAAGMILAQQGDVARARAMGEEALALAERRRDPAAAAAVLTYLGLRADWAGEMEEGTRLLREALRRREALGDSHGVGETLFYLGAAADATGDTAAAAAHYAAALGRLGAVGDAQLAGYVHCYLGVSLWKLGELPRAVEEVRAALQTSVSLRNRWLLTVGAQATVALVGAGAEPARRARLLGAADALAQATGAPFAWEGLPGGQDVVGLRERLAQGEGELSAAYREGRALPFGAVAALALRLLEGVARALASPEAAVERADQTSGPREPSGPPARGTGPPLSGREREVLRLVAQGLSNKAIGRQLFLSPSTVNYHLTSIFNKLGVDTRAQAVAVAARRGLL